jgi:hypothetical protein
VRWKEVSEICGDLRGDLDEGQKWWMNGAEGRMSCSSVETVKKREGGLTF